MRLIENPPWPLYIMYTMTHDFELKLTAVLLTPRANCNLLYIRISTAAKASKEPHEAFGTTFHKNFDIWIFFPFWVFEKENKWEIFLLDIIYASSMSTNNEFHNDFLGFDNTIQYLRNILQNDSGWVRCIVLKKSFSCVLFSKTFVTFLHKATI